MNDGQMIQITGWAAYVSAAASIIGFITIIIFFMIGQPWGSINDFTGSVVLGLSVIFLVWGLHSLMPARQPALNTLALVIGIIGGLGMAVAGAAVLLKTFGVITFPEPRPGSGPYGLGTYAPMVLGAWLILFNGLALTGGKLPSVLSWIGVAAGIGFVVTLIGFISSGPESPITAIGGLLTAIGYPVWAIWLGRLLLGGKLPLG